MALYAGLDPVAALKKWSEIRQKDPSTLTPEEKNDISGNMTGLAAENPQAWQAVKTGINDNGTSKDIFNPSTFSWEKQEDHGFWSHPESWLQLGFGGAVGGIGAASLLGGGGARSFDGSGHRRYECRRSRSKWHCRRRRWGGRHGRVPSSAPRKPPNSILGKAENIGKTISPILGGAAAGANQGQQANDALQLRAAQLGLEAPQMRLNNSVRASIAANAKPVPRSRVAHRPSRTRQPVARWCISRTALGRRIFRRRHGNSRRRRSRSSWPHRCHRIRACQRSGKEARREIFSVALRSGRQDSAR